MKTHYAYIVLITLICSHVCSAQQFPGENAASLEAFGVGGTASFNYEHNFAGDRGKKFTTIRVGLGVNHLTQSISIPHGFSINFPLRKSFVEAALLGSLASANGGTQHAFYYLAPCIGYRSGISRTHFFLRVYATYLVPLDPELERIPYFGLGLGRTFRAK